MTDKPAATGSGEPKLPEGADDPELFRKQRDWLLTECERLGITVNVAIGEDIRKAYRLSLPTPPASQPTVTEIGEWAKRLACYYPDTPLLLSRDNAMDRQEVEKRRAWFRAELQQFVLALLRAAEQKSHAGSVQPTLKQD